MSNPAHILVVEDDESLREVFAFHLERAGYTVEAVSDGEKALSVYAGSRHDIVVSDLRMPKLGGMELLHALQQSDPDVVVLIVTAFGGTDRAIEAMRAGAFHYVEKPVNMKAFLALVERAVDYARLRRANREQARPAETMIVAASPAMNEVLRLVDKVADSDASILVLGESGTGKELVARAIHERSSRAKHPFVAVNCAAIPDELLESTLFGHERGAFTGADKATAGKFRTANHGTIFLDEIAEMSSRLQAKLLRVLQNGEVEVVGADKPSRVDVRVLAATHRDIRSRVSEGEFREDLFYRLNVVSISIPPLRERREDIPVLVRFFLRKNAPNRRFAVSSEVDSALATYDWPGNVRELENVVRRMILLSDDGELTTDVLPTTIGRSADATGLPFELPEDGLDLFAHERALIFAAIEKMGGNQSAAARYLNIPRHVLLYRLEKYAADESE